MLSIVGCRERERTKIHARRRFDQTSEVALKLKVPIA